VRIAICGANGFIGTKVSRVLVKSGHEVVRVGREHFEHSENLANSLEGCDAVINLCGAPITKKWDEAYKHELYVSRIETTKKLLKEIATLDIKPKLFISISSVAIYKEDLVHDENSNKYGTSYLALLAKEWENEAQKAKQFGLRSVIFRMGVVLGKDGGLAEDLRLTFKIGLGAIPGNGKQPFSWVHVDDVTNALKKALEDEKMNGIYNLVSPESVNMKTFMSTFGKAMGRPAWLYVPEKVVRIRYGEGAESFLRGSFVLPNKLEEEGYTFKYDNLEKALKSIV
jgi:uncharacterized protein (TIGR01777 family)